jgi:uncharacterized protein
MEKETRIWNPAIQELRAETGADGKTRITGLAVPYGQTSEDLGGFREIFVAGAFADSLMENRDVMADVEHDAAKKLARRKAGTMDLRDTPDGLRVAITLPDTSLGRDTAEEVRSGLLDGMSIVFSGPESQWMGKGKDTIRKVTKANLRAVTLTAYPAYRQTIGTLSLRSLEAYQAEATEPEADTGTDILRRRIMQAGAE